MSNTISIHDIFMSLNGNTTGAISGEGTADQPRSGAPGCCWVCVTLSFSFPCNVL